jgi:hypothetical protein
MKNYFFIAILIFSVYFSQAQIVNIPDANFKNALVNTHCVDTNGDGNGDADADINNDGEIQESEAEVVLRLYVENNAISSLEGIQSFTNLIWLWCWDNQLSSLDVTQNLNLESLFCGENPLSGIDVTQNLNLERLSCDECGLLTSLDLTQNSQLEELFCWGCQLTQLDISQNPNITRLFLNSNQLSSLNLKNGNNQNINRMLAWDNPNLTCIQVDDETATYPNCDPIFLIGWCKDQTAQYSENCSLGTGDLNSFNISIYPNPVQNILYINSEFPIEHITIYTLQGQLINETTNNQIDVSKLNSGIYIASIIIDGKKSMKKIIKK